MVSKIAVMALVAVVAVPILLGYGLNIQTESYTAWEQSTDYIDATKYLKDITDTSKLRYTAADLYQFNSNSFYFDDAQIYPYYKEKSNNAGSVKLNQGVNRYTGSFYAGGLFNTELSYLIYGGYDASNYYSFTFTYTDNTTETFDHVKYLYWKSNGTTAEVQIVYYLPSYAYVSISNVKGISGYGYGNTPNMLVSWDDSNLVYANVAKGYTLNTDYPVSTSSTSPKSGTCINADGILKSIVMTFNLDSISSPDYWMQIKSAYDNTVILELKKTTVGGTATWSYNIPTSDGVDHELYYNPALSNNTYQLYLNGQTNGELRYVGSWTNTFGILTSLITYQFDYNINYTIPDSMPAFYIMGRTPTMRIDHALVATYSYRVFANVTYDPSIFKTNPHTVIDNLSETGSSIQFGGNTYTVTDGNITIGTRSISLRNMEFDSVPVAGGYENSINGTVVSITANPSSIVFNGDWNLSVKTTSQSSVQKENTHWVPGKFAWQGVDTNFKLVGLMASLGAFIGLAVYGRRSGARVMPLLVVCGGAALMFLVMI